MKSINGVLFPDDEEHFARMVDSQGYYQKDIFLEAISHVTNPKIFYDIGAHVGLWSLMAIKHGFRTVYAYEPNQKTFQCLEANLSGRGGDYKAYLRNYGVSQIKNIFMKVIEETPYNSGAVKLIDDKDNPNAATAPIDGDCLYEMIEYYQLRPHQVLVKIDTEGMEAQCVLGMEKILYAFRPVVVVEQRTNNDALDILQKMGMYIVRTIRKDHILLWRDYDRF